LLSKEIDLVANSRRLIPAQVLNVFIVKNKDRFVSRRNTIDYYFFSSLRLPAIAKVAFDINLLHFDANCVVTLKLFKNNISAQFQLDHIGV
jgi:hypothetical protein